MSDPSHIHRNLDRVRRATIQRGKSEDAWKAAIRTAVAEGSSLRAVASEAGVTHVRVLQIVRE